MNDENKHYISIGIVRIEDNFLLKLVIKGTLSHCDYEQMILLLEYPLLSIKGTKIKVLVDAREFDGWHFKAAWDDLKFGLKHNKEFTKLAFVGNKVWESYSIKISDWFICGEMKYFEKMANATSWLEKDEKK